MENTTFDWLDGEDSLNYGTPEVPTVAGPEPAKPAKPARQPNEPISQMANRHYHFSD